MESLTTNDLIMTAPRSLGEVQNAGHIDALNKLEQCKALTKAGKEWFILATDPFHDERLQLSGFPDANVSGSVIQCVKQSVQLKCPTAITGNWDCHVVNFPILDLASSYPYLTYGDTSTAQTQAHYTENQIDVAQAYASVLDSYVSVCASVSGLPIYADATGAAVKVAKVGLDPQYTAGSSRVISTAFEVTNTTADLYKQGQVTCYRQPAPSGDTITSELWSSNDGKVLGTIPTYRLRSPPKNLAEAQLLEGTSTWPAEEGCYVISTMNCTDNPPKQPVSCAVALDVGDIAVDDSATSEFMYSGVVDYNPPGHTGDVLATVGRTKILPYNLAGAYFTGLSNQTTLQLTVKYFIERFPDPSTTDLVVLAQPSPGFDPCALELYSHTISKMPVGVPQGQNSFGDWFRGIVNKVATYSTPILKFLAPIHPIIGGAAALSGAAKAFTGKRPDNKEKAFQRVGQAIFEKGGGVKQRRKRKKVMKRIADGQSGSSAWSNPGARVRY